jgi:phosphatidate phosphatase PAH1
MMLHLISFREVILRKPEEFKIACLRDIQRLFKSVSSPFYAGFGNRITDAISYRQVDVPSSRIFTIDPSGKVLLLSGFDSSYIKLNDLVDQIFPPLADRSMKQEYNDFNYWRSGIPEIDLVFEGVAEMEDDGRGNDGESEYSEEDEFADVSAVTEVPVSF